MSKESLPLPFARYLPMVEAVVELFFPLVEGAMHDLQSGKLIALYNNLSRRRVGETTPLQELNVTTDQFPDHFPPYLKRNWDGRELKSVSITVRDEKGKAVGLICFNFDISLFSQVEQFLGSWLKVDPKADNPVAQFTAEGEEKVIQLIDELVKEQGFSPLALDRKSKREIILTLNKKGVFLVRNAVSITANYLQLSRATIYNIIKRGPPS